MADGRTAAIFAAFQLGLPCVNVSNQTSLEPFFRDSNFLVRLIGKPVELKMQTATTLAEVTLIPDLLPPNTVCLTSLGNSRHIMKKQCFVGPVVSSEFFESSQPVDMKNPFVLRELLNDKRYRENAALYSRMSKMMNGPQKAAQIILELSGRIQCY